MKVNFVVLMVFCCLGSAVDGSNIRGQIARQGPYGDRFGVGAVTVVLRDQWNNQQSTPSTTGYDGMYYIYSVRPGTYFLDAYSGPYFLGRYQIGVGNVPERPGVFWDIGPILVP